MSGDSVRVLLQNHYLFGKLTDEEIGELLTHARIERYRAGSEIFAKGMPGQSMMGVLRGLVRISAPSPEGNQIVLNMIKAGEIFGEIALIDGGERTADASALTDCELVVVYRRDFMPLLHRRPDICILLLEIVCGRLRQTSEQVEDVLFADLGCRLAKALLRLAREPGAPGGQPSGPVLHITQRQLGGMVGGARESVNRHLKAWQKAGLVRLGKGTISISDVGGLERMV